MELSFLELERAEIDDEIAAAETNGGPPPVELQRRRAELTERDRPQPVVEACSYGNIRSLFRPAGRDNELMDRDLLSGWLETGMSLAEIGALTDRDPSTVGYWVQEARTRRQRRAKYARAVG